MAKAKLADFEGQNVVATTIAIRNTGDGLSNALAIEPKVMHQHDLVYVVLECAVTEVSFPASGDSETEVERKHILKAGTATIVEPGSALAAVKAAIAEQADKIQKHRDEKTNAQGLDLSGVGSSPTTPADELASRRAEKAPGAAAKPPKAKAAGAKKVPAKKAAAKKVPAKKD